MDLLDIRDKIDEIDREIVNAYEKRMKLCREVAAYKIQNGKKVLDREREEAKIAAVEKMAESEFTKKSIGELFSQIMAGSRKMQYGMLREAGLAQDFPFTPVEQIERNGVKVVYQGVEGAYSEEAMLTYFGEQTEAFHVETFKDAMQAIEDGRADYAVLPIENSSAGSVSDVYDLLVEFDNTIVGEQIINIRHALLGLAEASMEDIEVVYSHPQGLMQSARFLEEHKNWQQISVKNTAMAAKKILEDGDIHQAAIASERAAAHHGLKILKKEINFSESNSTRFIVVTGRKIFARNADKVSICFELPHRSGSLYQILSHFIFNNLNMTKIESRPLENRNWEYRFFVDVEGNLQDASVQNALYGIQEEAVNLKILGNY